MEAIKERLCDCLQPMFLNRFKTLTPHWMHWTQWKQIFGSPPRARVCARVMQVQENCFQCLQSFHPLIPQVFTAPQLPPFVETLETITVVRSHRRARPPPRRRRMNAADARAHRQSRARF
jgi:hypothetical protein